MTKAFRTISDVLRSPLANFAKGGKVQLLTSVGGDKGALNTLDKLQKAKNEAEDELAELLDRLHQSKGHNETLEKNVVTAANKTESLNRQAEAVSRMIDATTSKHRDAVAAIVADAAKAAAEKAEETRSILATWGDGSGGMERKEINRELLETVRKSDTLKAVAQHLGRLREMLSQAKKNGYAYGRGEKYSLELGNNLSRALTSELAMLASPETIPLFLRRYQRKQIKQYRRREPIRKGAGDIICCLDESDSTRGDNAAWGKAVALTLLEIAAEGGRSFALIHFSGAGGLHTDVFRPGEYTAADKMTAAERFLGGGTDFKPPMREAVSLMENEGFENADIVFITDGLCGAVARKTDGAWLFRDGHPARRGRRHGLQFEGVLRESLSHQRADGRRDRAGYDGETSVEKTVAIYDSTVYNDSRGERLWEDRLSIWRSLTARGQRWDLVTRN